MGGQHARRHLHRPQQAHRRRGQEGRAREGLWHRTFSCLVVSPSTQTVLLQKKQPGRYVFDRPDHADFTVGGHYEAGESIADGVREIREELGLDVDYKELQPLGIRQTAVALAPKWIEREFQYWHLLALPLGLEEIPLDDAEVSGLVQIGLDDAIALAAATVARPRPAT
ncbi:NUDIX domain-containing protein [Streptosporangium lutulentum]